MLDLEASRRLLFELPCAETCVAVLTRGCMIAMLSKLLSRAPTIQSFVARFQISALNSSILPKRSSSFFLVSSLAFASSGGSLRGCESAVLLLHLLNGLTAG